jgi:hypothetical protein
MMLNAVAAELLLPGLLDFGRSLNEPTLGHGRFLAFWMLYGSFAVAFLSLGLTRFFSRGRLVERLVTMWQAGPDSKWIFYGSVFGFLIPALLRTFLLYEMPLTDDEAAYHFMAEVIATGRVTADSPSLRLFFDSRFLINDGKLYAHYFVGWPALLAPGLWLGIPGFMNALYSALTVPTLFALLRRLSGSSWARAGVLLYLTSPMLMLAAATETAHTSCVAALAACTWFCLKSREPGAAPWHHSAASLAFSVAFFVRPTSALGVGLPLLAWWFVGWWKNGRKGTPLLAFVLPALMMATLFFEVNRLQTGSALEVAYQRAYTYAEENGFRFSLWSEEMREGSFSEFDFTSPRRFIAIASAALFRLSTSLFGWPCSLLFVVFSSGQASASTTRNGRLISVLWLSVLSYFMVHLATHNVGIDTFAPMHYFEVAWPLLILTVAGLENLTRKGARIDRLTRHSLTGSRRLTGSCRFQVVPATLLAALIMASLAIYVPFRLGAVWRVADNVAMPHRALEEAGIERAVIFAPEPFIYYCKHPPTRGWVFVRPNNDPRLENDILWVNHLSLEKDRFLMRHQFPHREAYIMQWDVSCKTLFLPLDQATPGIVPDAKVAGIENVGNETNQP